MATNLEFLYPHIPFTGTNGTFPTADTGYNSSAVITGPRANFFRASASGTSVAWDWDYGTTVTPNYCVIAHADWLTKRDTANISYTIRGASDSGFVTGTNYTGTISTASLLGPTLSDSYISFSPNAYRYWRVTLTTTASMKHMLSKIYLGTAFDLGRDPEFSSALQRYASGTHRQSKMLVELEYEGVLNATRQSFFDTIVKYADSNPVFLRDSNNVFLNNVTLLHARIIGARVTSIGLQESAFSLILEEVIG